MISDGYDVNPSNRDIFLRLYNGNLQKISEFYPLYDPLHYILLFPRGDDGCHIDVFLTGVTKRKRVTTMQFYFYRLQIRDKNWL